MYLFCVWRYRGHLLFPWWAKFVTVTERFNANSTKSALIPVQKRFPKIFFLLTSSFICQVLVNVLGARLRSTHRCCSTGASGRAISFYRLNSCALLPLYHAAIGISNATTVCCWRPGNIWHPHGPKSTQRVDSWPAFPFLVSFALQ